MTVWRPPSEIRGKALGLPRRGRRLLIAEVQADDGRLKGVRPLGGSVEFGERADAALVREFREVCGVGQPLIVTLSAGNSPQRARMPGARAAAALLESVDAVAVTVLCDTGLKYRRLCDRPSRLCRCAPAMLEPGDPIGPGPPRRRGRCARTFRPKRRRVLAES